MFHSNFVEFTVSMLNCVKHEVFMTVKMWIMICVTIPSCLAGGYQNFTENEAAGDVPVKHWYTHVQN
jgi:hypothetical protein